MLGLVFTAGHVVAVVGLVISRCYACKGDVEAFADIFPFYVSLIQNNLIDAHKQSHEVATDCLLVPVDFSFHN